MKTGIATIPLDYGRCPRWLFERMEKLGRGVVSAIVEEFGPEEFVKRLADPIWFQSLSCAIGMDWNSSGSTAITLGALKSGLFEVQDELGLYICGGKKVSRKTPEEITAYGISRGFSFASDLIYASKMSAKVDSSLIQDGFTLYQHNLIFTKSGSWAVIQQGMNIDLQKARRYHWFSKESKDFNAGGNNAASGTHDPAAVGPRHLGRGGFIEEPHSGIVSDARVNPLNLTDKDSRENRDVSVGLATEEPKKTLKNLSLIRSSKPGGRIQMELFDKEFYWHPVADEKFDMNRLEKTINSAREQSPQNFEQLLGAKNVGPKTIRALSLVAELIYGAKPSYEDPARYSFSFGGKDGVPYPVDRESYDNVLKIMGKGIFKSKVSFREKSEAIRSLAGSLNQLAL